MSELTMAVVPESFLNELKNQLQEVKYILQKKENEEVNSQWIESNEARKMLGVSTRTWQTYRDERVIPFSQFGRKIFVQRKDIEAFLNNHKIN